LYATPTVTGSRSGAPAAVAWATLKAMGGASYARTAAEVHALTARFAGAVQAIPQLRLVGQPSACVVAFTTAPGAPFGIYSLAARMEARGHHMNSLQDPPAAAFVVTERAEAAADDWVASLAACAAEAVANPRDPRFEGKGSAGIYGASAVLPPTEIGRILQRYCDVLYMVRPGGK
jgi:sphinganine-1-phosphate aldolase